MINLVKGQKIDLSKETNLTTLRVGLGWDESRKGADVDCDASCILVDSNDTGLGSLRDCVLYYGNQKLPGLVHGGDNRTGAGEGDDETIDIDLSKLPSNTGSVVIFMNIYKASSRGQSFKDLQNAYIRVCENTGKELCRFDLNEDYGTCTGLIAGKIYKKENTWKFAAIGEPVKDCDLVTGITERYGVSSK